MKDWANILLQIGECRGLKLVDGKLMAGAGATIAKTNYIASICTIPPRVIEEDWSYFQFTEAAEITDIIIDEEQIKKDEEWKLTQKFIRNNPKPSKTTPLNKRWICCEYTSVEGCEIKSMLEEWDCRLGDIEFTIEKKSDYYDSVNTYINICYKKENLEYAEQYQEWQTKLAKYLETNTKK